MWKFKVLPCFPHLLGQCLHLLWFLPFSAHSCSHSSFSTLLSAWMNKPFLWLCVSSTLGTSGVSSGHLSTLQKCHAQSPTCEVTPRICQADEKREQKSCLHFCPTNYLNTIRINLTWHKLQLKNFICCKKWQSGLFNQNKLTTRTHQKMAAIAFIYSNPASF